VVLVFRVPSAYLGAYRAEAPHGRLVLSVHSCEQYMSGPRHFLSPSRPLGTASLTIATLLVGVLGSQNSLWAAYALFIQTVVCRACSSSALSISLPAVGFVASALVVLAYAIWNARERQQQDALVHEQHRALTDVHGQVTEIQMAATATKEQLDSIDSRAAALQVLLDGLLVALPSARLVEVFAHCQAGVSATSKELYAITSTASTSSAEKCAQLEVLIGTYLSFVVLFLRTYDQHLRGPLVAEATYSVNIMRFVSTTTLDAATMQLYDEWMTIKPRGCSVSQLVGVLLVDDRVSFRLEGTAALKAIADGIVGHGTAPQVSPDSVIQFVLPLRTRAQPTDGFVYPGAPRAYYEPQTFHYIRHAREIADVLLRSQHIGRDEHSQLQRYWAHPSVSHIGSWISLALKPDLGRIPWDRNGVYDPPEYIINLNCSAIDLLRPQGAPPDDTRHLATFETYAPSMLTLLPVLLRTRDQQLADSHAATKPTQRGSRAKRRKR
jgi:hypothetical protein